MKRHENAILSYIITRIMFYQKATVEDGTCADDQFKVHVQALHVPSLIACNKRGLLIKDCVALGPDPPDATRICRSCVASRPELRSMI